jgi:hypothetical protein
LEIIYYTLIAAGLYLVSNWILDRLEVSRGARFEYRSFIFFFIILTLAIIAFGLINLTMPSSAA